MRAKTVVQAAEVDTLSATEVNAQAKADDEAARIVELLGPNLILKPTNEGRSVGLRLTHNRDELAAALLDGSKQ
ncbi:hypothetical protein OG787_47020 [Streptomyces sp. NBC_00075]|uniref:hypothetical protein n=1 Tax=Streptomyces sp. NBC_00075 TaxID=2975641 RepID=UPI003250FEDC